MTGTRPRLLTALALVAAMLFPTTSAQAAGLDVARVAGADRFATAVEVSKAAWPEGAPVAFVATGRTFADAVAIAAAAGAVGPVLLTQPDALPSVTAAELNRLDPSNIVVLGGPRAVSEDVRLAIARNARGTAVAVDRIAGSDRFGTAIAIAQEINPNPEVVYLADGYDFRASLVASAAAGIRGGVLLTTDAQALPGSVNNELARIQPTELVIVGTVSSAVRQAASRWAGSTRVIDARTDEGLSVEVSQDVWAGTTDVLLASSADFPDALAAGAWAVKANVPLLLTNPAKLENVTACEIFRLEASGAVITGGPNAIKEAVADALREGISPFARGCAGSALIPIPDPDPNTAAVEVTLYEMTTSPDGKRAYVINNAWNSVEVIDLEQGIWLGRIATGSNPIDLDITADGKRLYVANNGSQTISVIDTTRSFDQAEVQQIRMLRSGTNARRPFAIETSVDGKSFIIPARLEAADGDACIQVLSANGTLTELEPTTADIPYAAVGAFHSADHKLIGVIAPDRDPDGDQPKCTDGDAPAPAPSPTPTTTPTEGVAEETETAPLALFTYTNGAWKRVGAWGRNVAEVAYGKVSENGVSTDGAGTTTVFEAVGSSAVIGTVTSDAGASFGLAVEPLQAGCPANRGNPAQCTQLAYNVVVGEDGLGAVDVLDITNGRNVAGSFRVIDRFPLRTVVGAYGGKNQPGDPGLQNQAAVTADASRLVIATEQAVEVFPIG